MTEATSFMIAFAVSLKFPLGCDSEHDGLFAKPVNPSIKEAIADVRKARCRAEILFGNQMVDILAQTPQRLVACQCDRK